VELVVLSACSSLLGRSGRGAGMEGLAWAFLQAGVTQVIASRYPVDDRATVTFMRALYRHLQDLPVAEALGRTRDECLRAEGLPLREVGAWSVWG
jgi:CHAT domain-containing protein